MRLSVHFALGITIGFFIAWFLGSFTPYSYSIRIIDSSSCKSPIYEVITDAQTISVTGTQINYNGLIAPNGAEAIIYVRPQFDSTEKYSYKIRATYSNCESISTRPRTVKLGWFLYESIHNGNIKHTVRAK